MMIMKKTFQYFTWAALTFSLAACTQEDTLQEFNAPNAVRIHATIGSLQSRVAYGTDGSTDFTSGDAIKVVNTKRTSKNEATYTTTDGKNWTTTDAFVWNSGTEANNQFNAWYPATASFDSFDLPTEQNREALLAAADWMTATTEVMAKPEDCKLALSFQHKLAKVTVNISNEFGSEYGTTAPTLTDVKICTSDGVKTITPLAGTGSYTAIVTPGTYTSSSPFMTLKANDVALTVKASETLVAGSHYTFTLKVGKDAATIGEVTVAPWGTGTPLQGGVAEAVPYYYNAETNTHIVYQEEYLKTAIDEAEQTGTVDNPATVKLMTDVEVAGEPDEYGNIEQDILVDAGVIVLDLNGHTITGSDKSSNVIQIGYGDGETTASATLTIDDSSEGKQGKIIAVYDNQTSKLLLVRNGSKLIVNNGTFEGNVYGIYGQDESASITINGGAFKFGRTAIRPQKSFLTITGGTFEGSEFALHFSNAAKALITGGSFVGGEYDINTQQATGFLSFNEETGVGPTFPGGFSIYNKNSTSFTLKPLLAEGAGYYVNDELQTLANDARSCEGDVTVKRISTNE